jgi:hypothetical protein
MADTLAVEKKVTLFEMIEDKSTLIINSTKKRGVDMLIKLMPMRPDLTRLEINQNLDQFCI